MRVISCFVSYGKRPSIKEEQMEDVTNIYNTILLPTVVQISCKTGKVEKDEALLYHWKQKK